MLAGRLCLCAVGLVGCSGGLTSTGEVLGGSRTVTGEVIDFKTGAVLDAPASVSVSGLLPQLKITAQGAAFTIEGVPDNSVFQILASAPPNYRATFSQSIAVGADDLDGAQALIVDEQFLASVAAAFGVSPTAARGVLFVRLVDAAGQPRAGVDAAELAVDGASAPRFLDANLVPAPGARASSASGWAVMFEVPPGVASLGAVAGATVTLEMAASPIAAGSVTLADAKVSDGPPVVPKDVSFAGQIAPIFVARGCVACHTGNGIGKDLGNLTLGGGTNLVHRELTVEVLTRVNLAMPELSRVLTMPSRETPPDRHPNVTFAGTQDPDYVKLLVWIREGAKNN